MSLIGVLLSFVVLIYLMVKRDWSMLTATIPASLVIIIFDGMDLWQGLQSFYSSGVGSGVQSYFLLLTVGSLFGHFMAESGCALKIAHILIRLLGRERVGLTMYFLTLIMVYGGISVLVVVFTVGPIGLVMCKEANLPRKFLFGAILSGAAGPAMTSIPGTPSLTNLIPTNYLPTDAMAAPILGIISSVIQIVLCLLFLKWLEKHYKKTNQTFDENEDVPVLSMDDFPEEGLPSGFIAFVPVIIQVGFIIFLSKYLGGSTAAAIYGCGIACAFNYVVNHKNFKQNLGLSVVHGAQGGITAAINLGAIVGFGIIIKNTKAFTVVYDFCCGLGGGDSIVGILFAELLAVSIFVAVCASAGGGLEIFWEHMGPVFVAKGVNVEVLHRISSIAAGGFDSLPHNSAYPIFCTVLGTKFGDCYPLAVVTVLIIPIISAIVCIFAAGLGIC